MKTRNSAKYAIESKRRNGIRASIDHASMPGVSPEMMRWWFENVDAWTIFNGTDFSGPAVRAYRYWHWFDHIKVTWKKRKLSGYGGIGPGRIIQIEGDIGRQCSVRA